jgi:hypothetical protein
MLAQNPAREFDAELLNHVCHLFILVGIASNLADKPKYC